MKKKGKESERNKRRKNEDSIREKERIKEIKERDILQTLYKIGWHKNNNNHSEVFHNNDMIISCRLSWNKT